MKRNNRLIPYKVFLLLAGISLICSACSTKDQERNQSDKTCEANYKLYPTQNVFILLKLNTVDGRIWVVQYSVDDPKTRFEIPISKAQIKSNQSEMQGRYELVPTQNMWTSILLDRIDGYQWQVQWSLDGNHQVIPIEPLK